MAIGYKSVTDIKTKDMLDDEKNVTLIFGQPFVKDQ